MKFFGKTLGLLLASLTLVSCGGGGGDGGAFTAPQSGTLTMTATTTQLPVNIWGYSPLQYGNPTQAEVTIVWRNADGTLVSGKDIHVSIAPTNYAALSCLVDGKDCKDGSQLFGSVVISGINGQATIFVNSTTVPGTATVTVSGIDPTTTRTVSASLNFTITSGVGPAPASITLQPTPAGVYLPSSGGGNTSSISATVLDGAGQLVPDPVTGNNGFDNVQFEIVGSAGDARLSSSSVAGSVSGATVKSHTVHGVAIASFQAGDATPQGPVQIRATVDRADNNVSNGIQDPVSATTSVIVSDGKLYSLQITSPDINAILVNTVSNDATLVCQNGGGSGADCPPGSGLPPLNPDGSYSLTVSALGTDRQGNPVLPGTPIRFGSIDEPAGAFNSGVTANQFLLAGGDGDPSEGSAVFIAPTGHFQTAGGGAGPGDALVVFGKTQHGAPTGNEDLESVLTVQHVNSQTSLNTTSPFNRNDTTGTSVDNHAVLPYIIGRANHGNITATGLTNVVGTNAVGVAHATLNYTVSTLGHIVAMWAQGDGIDRVTGGSRRVTDAVQLIYPGIAPATVVAFPNPIPGNKSTSVTVCITDALNSPIQGVRFNFQMQLGGGTGSVDGNGVAGTLDNTTGPNGCVDAAVVTSGLPVSASASSPSGTIVFSVGSANASVNIVVQLAFISNAGVGSVCSSGTPTAVANIKAFTTGGDPAAGVSITAACTGVTVTPGTSITGSNGIAQFSLTGAVGATGSCTFTATGVAPITVAVKIPAAADFSPPC